MSGTCSQHRALLTPDSAAMRRLDSLAQELREGGRTYRERESVVAQPQVTTRPLSFTCGYSSEQPQQLKAVQVEPSTIAVGVGSFLNKLFGTPTPCQSEPQSESVQSVQTVQKEPQMDLIQRMKENSRKKGKSSNSSPSHRNTSPWGRVRPSEVGHRVVTDGSGTIVGVQERPQVVTKTVVVPRRK